MEGGLGGVETRTEVARRASLFAPVNADIDSGYQLPRQHLHFGDDFWMISESSRPLSASDHPDRRIITDYRNC